MITLSTSHRSASQATRFGWLLALLLLGIAPSAFGQSEGDFRSRQSGNWSQSNRWEEFTGGAWVNTGNTPNVNSGQITIRNGHEITGNVRAIYDDILVEAGATLRTNQVFRIDDGPGTDLEVYGTLRISRTTRLINSATAIFRPGSVTNVDTNDRFRFEGTSTATWETGSVLNMSGIFQVEDNATVNLNANTDFTNNDRIIIRDSGVMNVSNSTIYNDGNINVNNSGALNFQSGSTYVHTQNGGRLPTPAGTTWAAGSEAIISGVTNSAPTRMTQAFNELTWNSTGQTGSVDVNANGATVAGDLVIESTGSGQVVWDGNGSALPISGDFIQNGGDFVFTNGGSDMMTVGGDFTQTAGSFDLAAANGTPDLQIAGDLTVNGTFTASGSNSPSVTLNGSTTQTITVNGTTSGSFDLNVNGTGGAVLATDLSIPGSITETSGGLDFGGNNVELTGSLSVATSITGIETVTFNGTTNATISLPAADQTVPNLVVDMPGATLTMSSDITITESLIVRDGTFDVNGFVLTIAEGATFYSPTPLPITVTVSRTYSQASDGWRMISSPVTGPVYSDLNAPFITQGATWADKTEGTANLQSFTFGSQDWSPLSGADAAFASGSGYIMYMFAQDELGANVLPATWTVTGTPGALTTTPMSWSGDANTSFNYVGNPSTTNIDWDQTYGASTNVWSSYATWDPALTTGGGTTGYRYYDALSGIGTAGRYIAPFTAFMVQATANGSSLVMSSNEAAAAASANQFGKGGGDDRFVAPHIRLLLEGQGLAENEMVFSFGHEATDKTDFFDVIRLQPLAAQFATLWSQVDDRRLAYDGRTMDSGREIYELSLATSNEGIYTLKAPEMYDIPSHWTVKIIDLTTGNEADFSAGESLVFRTDTSDLVTPNRRFESQRSARFRVVIEDPDRAAELDEDITTAPDSPVLAQNYPNPFNPSTTIRFSLPEGAVVRLEVFDVVGRRVAVLMDEFRPAGWHETVFRADGLTSGVYLYRLSYGTQAVTRRMLMLK